MNKRQDDKTVPFFKVKKLDREQAIKNMRTYTDGDPTRLTVDLAKTAFKAVIGTPNSQIAAVPLVVESVYGPTLRISLKDQPHPAFASLQQLRSFI